MEACCLICTLSIDLSLSFSLPPWKPMLYLLEANIIFFGGQCYILLKGSTFLIKKGQIDLGCADTFHVWKVHILSIKQAHCIGFGCGLTFDRYNISGRISSDWFGWLGDWVSDLWEQLKENWPFNAMIAAALELFLPPHWKISKKVELPTKWSWHQCTGLSIDQWYCPGIFYFYLFSFCILYRISLSLIFFHLNLKLLGLLRFFNFLQNKLCLALSLCFYTDHVTLLEYDTAFLVQHHKTL